MVNLKSGLMFALLLGLFILSLISMGIMFFIDNENPFFYGDIGIFILGLLVSLFYIEVNIKLIIYIDKYKTILYLSLIILIILVLYDIITTFFSLIFLGLIFSETYMQNISLFKILHFLITIFPLCVISIVTADIENKFKGVRKASILNILIYIFKLYFYFPIGVFYLHKEYQDLFRYRYR